MSETVQETGAGMLTRLSDELAAAVERAGAGTVTVYSRQRLPGTGIIWSEDGLIVTAHHIIEQPDDITIGLPDGRTVPATLIGRDPGSDVALLRAQVSGLTPPARSTATVRPGNLVLAVGRPGPSGPMASFGVISSVGGVWRTHRGSHVEGYIRADVAMLPGFSGGPLIDGAGQVLGMNTSMLGRGGGLTIPTAAIDAIVAALQTHGKIQRGYLGIGAQAVALNPRLTQAIGVSQERGLVVVSLDPEGPAERDGLMQGDIIVAINGEPVGSVEELQDKLSGDIVGRAVPIRLIRGGVVQDVHVTIGERNGRR
ncbi:MAG TPA: trypsin-like peptidase domain-containing protein [Thermomicrobiales bacterium]